MGRGLDDSINKCYLIYYENEQNGQVATDVKLKNVAGKHQRKKDFHKNQRVAIDVGDYRNSCQSENHSEDNNNQDVDVDRKRRLSGDSVDIPVKDEKFYKKLKYDATKDSMYQTYQPWVIKTYGDMAKTKTITIKKHERILKALSGLEQNKPDSSKFRFWVKAKGFTTERPNNFKEVPPFHPSNEPNNAIHLYIPNLTKEPGIQPYRKVAVVEQFFDIIYNVHVGLGGRSSRHAGQKRTYRTITESYAFLPRDAVTKFLAGCQFCKKSSKPHSPSSLIADDLFTESSSETDPLTAGSGIFSENSDSQLTADSTIETKFSENSRVVDVPIKSEDGGNSSLVVDWEEAINLEKSRTLSIGEKNSTSMQLIEQMNRTQQKTYFDEIYSKIQQFYGYQINNNFDMKDLAASNDLLNYYTLLKSFYDQSVAAHKLGIKSTETALLNMNTQQNQHISSQLQLKGETDPIIDLTISRPDEFKNNININIENGSNANSAAACSNKTEPTENNITINSAGVSINVLNNSKELKISCKTTPPKKRYSVYNHTEDNENTGHSQVNLSTKFNETIENRKTTDIEAVAVDNAVAKENRIYSKQHLSQVNDVKSTYLQLMRNMGFCDEDALKFDHL
ncbi:Nucleolar protein 4, partial [Pseudolycoriella hygida]